MALGLTSDQEAIREGVAELCKQFPGEYWRELDRESAYPEAFVAALTEGGWLAALIPEEYGGMGLGLGDAALILQEINRQGCNSGACHAQMYIMGTILRHGSEEQKQRYLPAHRRGRAAPAGLRRHRARCRQQHARAAHARGSTRRRRLARQRAEDLDEPRSRTPT